MYLSSITDSDDMLLIEVPLETQAQARKEKKERATFSQRMESTSVVATEEENEEDFMWNNNGGVGDSINDQKTNIAISVSNNCKDDRRLFEIYLSLKSNPDERMLVNISKRQTMQELYKEIVETLEIKNEHLRGLRGLRIREMFAPQAGLTQSIQNSDLAQSFSSKLG